MNRVLLLVGLVVFIGDLCASPAFAQGREAGGLAATGSLIASINRFSGDPSSKSAIDGEAIGGAGAISAGLTDRWLIQLEVEATASTSFLQSHDVRVGVGKAATTITVQRRTRNRPLLFSTLAGFRSAPHGRLQLQYLAGLTFLHLTRRVDSVVSGAPPALVVGPSEVTTNAPAATVGVDAELRITHHLALVPAVRASAFNSSETPSGFLVRPAFGLRWTF